MKKFSLFNNGIWKISAVRAPNPCLFVENLRTGFCDWPMLHRNNRLVWDFPERLPRYIKRVTASLLGHRNDQWARLEDCVRWSLI